MLNWWQITPLLALCMLSLLFVAPTLAQPLDPFTPVLDALDDESFKMSWLLDLLLLAAGVFVLVFSLLVVLFLIGRRRQAHRYELIRQRAFSQRHATSARWIPQDHPQDHDE